MKTRSSKSTSSNKSTAFSAKDTNRIQDGPKKPKSCEKQNTRETVHSTRKSERSSALKTSPKSSTGILATSTKISDKKEKEILTKPLNSKKVNEVKEEPIISKVQETPVEEAPLKNNKKFKRTSSKKEGVNVAFSCVVTTIPEKCSVLKDRKSSASVKEKNNLNARDNGSCSKKVGRRKSIPSEEKDSSDHILIETANLESGEGSQYNVTDSKRKRTTEDKAERENIVPIHTKSNEKSTAKAEEHEEKASSKINQSPSLDSTSSLTKSSKRRPLRSTRNKIDPAPIYNLSASDSPSSSEEISSDSEAKSKKKRKIAEPHYLSSDSEEHNNSSKFKSPKRLVRVARLSNPSIDPAEKPGRVVEKEEVVILAPGYPSPDICYWDDLIERVVTIRPNLSGGFTVFILWINGKCTAHCMKEVRIKGPQKLIEFFEDSITTIN